MENSKDIQTWLRLIRANGVGPRTFLKLVEKFGSPERVLGARAAELSEIGGIGIKSGEKILSSALNLNVSDELELANSHGAYYITIEDQRYPKALKVIDDPPPVLCVKGTLLNNDSLGVSIVGSRRASYYGSEQASRFAYLLSNSGFTIISGMARGIDTAAHRGAINAGGRTIGVQGCGLGKIFPPENRELFERITHSGACISELPFDTGPKRENFPARNRIIAAMGMASLIIEASLRSGAMITARLSLEYNREVMVVPGKIDSSLNQGSHKLIKQGAKLVDCIEDCMESLGYIGEGLLDYASDESKRLLRETQRPKCDVSKLNLSDDERNILEYLKTQAIHLDAIIAELDIPIGTINASLMSLRLKGLLRQLPGNVFVRT